MKLHGILQLRSIPYLKAHNKTMRRNVSRGDRILPSTAGDAFLYRPENGCIYFRDSGDASLERVAEPLDELQQLLNDKSFVVKYLAVQIVGDLVQSGKALENGQSSEHAVRFALFHVALSELHLSRDEASAVDGDNVEGLWRGVDLYYDYPVRKNIFVSPSIGYHDNKYTHTVLGVSVRQSSPTAGIALSYLGDDVLGLENLYWRFSLTFKYNFKEQEDTILGASIVSGDSFGFIPAIYIGYEFH